MNKLNYLFFTILLLISNSSFCFAIGDPVVFNLAQTNYSVYEGESITICLEGPSNNELSSLEGSTINLQVQNGWANFNAPYTKLEVRGEGNCFYLKSKRSGANVDLNYTVSLSSDDTNIVLPHDFTIAIKKNRK